MVSNSQANITTTPKTYQLPLLILKSFGLDLESKVSTGIQDLLSATKIYATKFKLAVTTFHKEFEKAEEHSPSATPDVREEERMALFQEGYHFTRILVIQLGQETGKNHNEIGPQLLAMRLKLWFLVIGRQLDDDG